MATRLRVATAFMTLTFRHYYNRPRLVLAAVLLAPLMLAGCGQQPEIRTYEVPASEIAVPFSCTVPDGWTLIENDDFSILAFSVADGSTAKMTVTRLRATDEYLLANANRWRRQLFQPPIANASELQDAQFGNRTGKLIAVAGQDKAKGTAIRGAVVEYQGQPWTFRMKGPEKDISAAAEQFDAFLKSVEFFEPSGDK